MHEHFIGLYEVDSIKADTLVACLKDSMLRMNWSAKNCRGQSYEGASNISGFRRDVATKIQQLETRAQFTLCLAQAVNLAACDTIKQKRVLGMEWTQHLQYISC